MESLRVVVIILAISSIGTAQSEKNCNLPSVSNLEKLISDALIAGDAPTRPTIVLMGAPHYLCQASGTCRGTYSGLSLLANYTCSGAAACRGGNPSQFDFACASGEWSISVGSTTVFSFIEIPEANSTVETRTDCGLCYNPALLQTADRLTHCVACLSQCNQGAMRCYGISNDSCCNFYREVDEKCISSCPVGRQVTPNFTCPNNTVIQGFVQPSYTFMENQGQGIIEIDGPSGLTEFNITGGSKPQPFVRTSGPKAVSESVSSLPSNFTVFITNDIAALEKNEVFTLTLTAMDSSIVIQQSTVEITIISEDQMTVGFSVENYSFSEASVGPVSVTVDGEALQNFSVQYTGDGSGSVTQFDFEADKYSIEDDSSQFPIVYPNNDLGLQEDVVFPITMLAHPLFSKDVRIGGTVGSEGMRETYATANVTVSDDDIVIVGFSENRFIFNESVVNVSVEIKIDRIFAAPFTVHIQSVGITSNGFFQSAPVINETILFQVGTMSLFSYRFSLRNDDVALEVPEMILLVLSSPSTPRVKIGEGSGDFFPNATVTIIDDDDKVLIGFRRNAFTFMESDSNAEVTIQRGKSSSQPYTININSVLIPMGGIVPSAPDINQTLSFGAGSTSPFLTFRLSLMDDKVAVEAQETFLLVLSSPSSPRVQIGGRNERFNVDFFPNATVTIIDDDRITVGFSSDRYSFSESSVGPVPVLVDGNALQNFSVRYINGPTMIVQMVDFAAGDYSPDERNITFPLAYRNDDIALQNNVVFNISILPNSLYLNIGMPVGDTQNLETYASANVTVSDDDIVIVGFRESSYTFMESDVNAAVTVARSLSSAAPYSVRINSVLMPINGLPQSAPVINDTIMFGAGSVSPFIMYQLSLVNDNVHSEQPETFLLVLSSPSSPRVQIGGRNDQVSVDFFPNATVTIIDDDQAPQITIGFDQASYTFTESDGSGAVKVVASQPNVDTFASVVGGPVQQPLVVISGTAVSENITTYPATVSFAIVNDSVALEDDEEYVLTLTANDPNVIVNPATTRIVIQDDDNATVTFRALVFEFSENRDARFAVSLKSVIPTGRSIRMVIDEVSRNDEPFVPSLGSAKRNITLTQQSDQFVTLVVTDDNIGLESPEIVIISLSAQDFPSRVEIEPFKRASIILRDNEVTIFRLYAEDTDSTTVTVEEGQQFRICVSKNIVTARNVRYIMHPIPRTANSGDYSPDTNVSGEITTLNMSDCQTFTALDDSEVEGNETFEVKLSLQRFGLLTSTHMITDDTVVVTIVDQTPPPTPTPTPPPPPPTPTSTPTPPPEVIDTVIGDPLFTVPFGVEIPQQHLCYEIRGIKDMYFNFISDSCVSVNAHYAERILASESTPLHVMDEIAIRAVNNAKQCTNILIDRTNCTTSVDNSVINAAYDVSGIRVIPRGNTVVITVPNCNDTDLEMEIECEEGDRLRFEVTRGINLREESHGLVGQFWNVDINIQNFNGTLRRGESIDNVFIITIKPPKTDARSFPAWLEQKTWDNRKKCYYAGNQNGGTVYELAETHNPLIEGVYKDYITTGPFVTNFRFSHFEEGRCTS